MEEHSEKLEDFITEESLLELFGTTKSVLRGLRHSKGLPFIALGRYKKLYREQSLISWLRKQERTINILETKPLSGD